MAVPFDSSKGSDAVSNAAVVVAAFDAKAAIAQTATVPHP
jgi:hypothetical protein